MFDTLEVGPDAPTASRDSEPAPVPLERLETEICELAGHLTAATCRFLVLLGDFDARRGWASWEMNSCAQWLSWKCQMSSGTAREHVRVAWALRHLPVIRTEFGAGRLSYAKVRALTRIATPDTDAGLAEIAGPMTGNQLERFARAHRQVSSVDDAATRVQRRLAWRFEEDGSLSGTFRLPPLQGAVLLKALRAAAGDLRHPHAPDPEHPDEAQQPRVSAETPTADQAPTADTPAVDTPAAQMIACSSSWSWMLHDSAVKLLDLGRRHRRPNAALRRGPGTRQLPLPVPGLRHPAHPRLTAEMDIRDESDLTGSGRRGNPTARAALH